jgi:ribosomal protein S20
MKNNNSKKKAFSNLTQEEKKEAMRDSLVKGMVKGSKGDCSEEEAKTFIKSKVIFDFG